MKQKKCNVKVMVGSRLVRSEQVNESLVPDYITSFRNFYSGAAKIEVCSA